MTTDDDDFLDDIFAQARAVPAPVSADLVARVLQGARPTSIWHGLLDVIGGWPAMGGMIAAGVAGLWIGVAPPSVITTYTAEWIGQDVQVDLWSDTTFGSEEWIDG